MVWSCPQHYLLISFPAHLHIASPAQSASMNAFQHLKWNKSFLFLRNLHILFLAPGGSVCLSAMNSQSLTSFPVSEGSAFSCAHRLLSGDGSSHKDSDATGILSQSLKMGVFGVVPTFPSYYPSTRLSPFFSHHRHVGV